MERLIVPRTVTVVDGERSGSAPLAEFRSDRAYVLLGDPGAGKTEAFRAECEKHADGERSSPRDGFFDAVSTGCPNGRGRRCSLTGWTKCGWGAPIRGGLWTRSSNDLSG